MNSYILLRRIRGPVIIIVFGITALLNQWNILSYGESWPLYLIAIGLLQLAERAAWSRMQDPYSGTGQYPGGFGAQYPGQPAPSQSAAAQETSTALSIPPWNEERK